MEQVRDILEEQLKEENKGKCVVCTREDVDLWVGKLEKEKAYKTPEGKDVKWVTQARDLGIYFSEQGDWKAHINHVRTSIMKKAGWLLRTFRNRDIKFLRFCWNTYLQPIADYCS